MSNQGSLQVAIRARTGKALDYNGDWHAMFDLDGIPSGTFNARLLQWINGSLGENFASLPEAQQELAVTTGFYNWSSMTGAMLDIPSSIPGDALYDDDGTTALMDDDGTTYLTD